MDYALHIVVEKVAINSHEVIKRDTSTSYAIQCPTSIGELGLGHAAQRALLEKVQNILLAEQSLMLAPGMSGCPTCVRIPRIPATQSIGRLPLSPRERWLLATLCDAVGIGHHRGH